MSKVPLIINMRSKPRKKKIFLILSVFIFLILFSMFFIDFEHSYPDISLITGLNEISRGYEYKFPDTSVNYKTSSEFIIKNDGNAELIIESISMRGHTDHFSIKFNKKDSRINPGKYIMFSVIFAPKTMGTKKITVSILSNDKDEKEYMFNISGEVSPVPAPENVFASGENEKITLTWDDVRGATSYNVYWSTSLNAPKYKISHVKMPFIHTGLKNGQRYYYTVTAENEYGESLESEIVTAKPGKTYYIDAVDGSDNNDGLTPETAWKTIDKINSTKFLPGEYILFKRGDRWKGRIEISSSGTEEDPITLGAYGRGDRPIITCRDHISGSELSSKWKKYSENIWYLYYGPYKIASRV